VCVLEVGKDRFHNSTNVEDVRGEQRKVDRIATELTSSGHCTSFALLLTSVVIQPFRNTYSESVSFSV
jgi:hypothetical protein